MAESQNRLIKNPKFLVVEMDTKDEALDMIQTMLQKGYVRLMLLDDLAKHPVLRVSDQNSTQSSSRRDQNRRSKTGNTQDTFYEPSPHSRSRSLTPSEPSASTKRRRVQEEDIYEDFDEDEDVIDLDTRIQTENLVVKPEYFDEAYEQQTSLSLLDQLAAPADVVPGNYKALKTHSIIRNSKFDDKDSHVCKLCSTKLRAPRGGRWNMQMHVISRHSTNKLYRCSECDFEDYRKAHMKRHSIVTHGRELSPILLLDDEKRIEWNQIMSVCFPEFSHRTGFLTNFKAL